MKNSSAICFLSVIPVRAFPSHSSEMVSQVLFGETMQVLEKDDHWIKMQLDYDGYTGWVDEKQILYIDGFVTKQINDNVQFVSLDVNTMALKGNNKESFYFPAGSTLPFFSDGKCLLGSDFFQVTSSNVIVPNIEEFETDVQETAKRFLNVPYLWGGRTHYGIDCSGFSQIVFKMLGIKIKRDASEQAEQGRVVDFLSEAQSGDLAFFDNEDGKITHVGIMLNNSQIIHASGRVKIDMIDNQGILSIDQKKYTHKLRIIKRYK